MPTYPDAPLGVYYDPLAYASFDHPYDLYTTLRDNAPVYYNPRRDLWVLSRYADVKECLRNSELYSNALGNDMDGTHDSYGPGNLIALDDPHHAVLRDIVQPSFAGRELLAMEAQIRADAGRLLRALVDKGGGDFAVDIALPLVFSTGLRLVGAPIEESKFWQDHLLRSMARTVGQFGIPGDAADSNQEAEAHIHEVIAARRAAVAAGDESDRADAIGQLLMACDRGLIDQDEAAGLAHLVLSAATDAPAALLTNCIAILDKFPALQVHLRDNPNAIKGFVEETLRYDTPGTNLCRQTTAAVTIHGVTIPPDSRVMILLGSANRDPRMFTDPDTFDISRQYSTENRILSFGEGIHACMGAPLARLITQVLMEELVALLDGTEVRVVGLPERWVKQMVRGFSRLPVKFVPAGEVQRTTKTHASTAHLESIDHLGARSALATRDLETDVRVVAKVVEADGVVSLTLEAVDEAPLPGWEAGSHVDLVIDGVTTRQYSLSGNPDDRRYWRFGILREADGRGTSRYIHDQLAVGDTLRVRGPRNNFRLVESPRFVFIAGGIGITPILPMIRQAEAIGADWCLTYGGRSRASMGFLVELAAYGDRVHVCPQDEFGLLDIDALVGVPRDDTVVYCCGPEPLLRAVELRCADWPEGALHVERFVAKQLTDPVLREPFELVMQKSGLTITVPVDKSILSAVEEAGVTVRSSCTEGTCGTCETAVVAGTPDHRDSVLNEEERGAGNTMMICVSRSCTPRLVVDL
jgi:cytochrome P450/ferredoxin-NADP reductase